MLVSGNSAYPKLYLLDERGACEWGTLSMMYKDSRFACLIKLSNHKAESSALNLQSQQPL